MSPILRGLLVCHENMFDQLRYDAFCLHDYDNLYHYFMIRGRDGRAASGVSFKPENFRILHSYKNAGVVSMIKNLQDASKQDSRFFVTLKKDASWADDR